jgi:hypothetical protein
MYTILLILVSIARIWTKINMNKYYLQALKLTSKQSSKADFLQCMDQNRP